MVTVTVSKAIYDASFGLYLRDHSCSVWYWDDNIPYLHEWTDVRGRGDTYYFRDAGGAPTCQYQYGSATPSRTAWNGYVQVVVR